MTRTITNPGSVSSDDNLLVLFVPKAGVVAPLAPTIVELTAATVKDVTRSLTASGGWAPTRNQDAATDERLTAPDVYEQPGRKSNQLQLQYVAGADDEVAETALAEGTEGAFYVRYAVPYTQDIAAADEFERWPVRTGIAGWDAPAANAVWTKTQKAFVTGPVETATVAGP